MRRNNETKTQTLTKSSQQLQQQLLQPPIYDSIATKPTQSFSGTMSGGMLGNNQAKTILSSATNPFSTYDRNTIDYRQLNSNHEPNYQQNYQTLSTAPSSNNQQMQQNHLLDFRQPANGTKFNDEFGSDARIAINSDLLNLSNSSIANQLLPNTSNGSGSSNGGGTVNGNGGIGIAPTRLSSTTNANTINSSTNKESNRNHHSNNRNHIITDTLPGPESCV